jgi:hypothetical protein
MYLVFVVVLARAVVRLLVAEAQKLAHYLVVTTMRRLVAKRTSFVDVKALRARARRGVRPFCFFGEVSCGEAGVGCWKAGRGYDSSWICSRV